MEPFPQQQDRCIRPDGDVRTNGTGIDQNRDGAYRGKASTQARRACHRTAVWWDRKLTLCHQHCNKCIATGSKKLLVARALLLTSKKGITTSNKKLLVAMHLDLSSLGSLGRHKQS